MRSPSSSARSAPSTQSAFHDRKESGADGRTGRAMHDLTAKRTLVKSPPELWSEVSELERLASHLGAFGEITITKLEPEHTVAWEGEGASGTVSIEPSGWGTTVTLRAQVDAAEPEPEPEPEPIAGEDPQREPAPRPGLFARLFGRGKPRVAAAEAVAAPEPE